MIFSTENDWKRVFHTNFMQPGWEFRGAKLNFEVRMLNDWNFTKAFAETWLHPNECSVSDGVSTQAFIWQQLNFIKKPSVQPTESEFHPKFIKSSSWSFIRISAIIQLEKLSIHPNLDSARNRWKTRDHCVNLNHTGLLSLWCNEKFPCVVEMMILVQCINSTLTSQNAIETENSNKIT